MVLPFNCLYKICTVKFTLSRTHEKVICNHEISPPGSVMLSIMLIMLFLRPYLCSVKSSFVIKSEAEINQQFEANSGPDCLVILCAKHGF